MIPKIIIKDGEKIVVDFMSNRPFNQKEEALVLGTIAIAEEKEKKEKKRKNESH